MYMEMKQVLTMLLIWWSMAKWSSRKSDKLCLTVIMFAMV